MHTSTADVWFPHGLALMLSLTLYAFALLANFTSSQPAAITQYGINSWVSTPNIALQRELAMPVRRMFVYWDSAQPASAQWNWSGFDAAYDALLRAHLRPLIDIYGSPCWARPSLACNNSHYTAPPDPAYDSYWTNFVRQAAQRYPLAIAIEIWNEPNLIWAWYPHVDPARYTQILGEAYHAIKSVRPSTPVLAGSLSSGGGDGGQAALGDAAFLQGMYQHGANLVMDGISTHIYPIRQTASGSKAWDPSVFEQDLARLRAVRAAYGAKQPIWITEVGESTGTSAGWPVGVSPAQQGRDLVSLADRAQIDGDVSGFLVNTIQDGAPNPQDPYSGVNQGIGVFGTSGAVKPAACALSARFGGSLYC